MSLNYIYSLISKSISNYNENLINVENSVNNNQNTNNIKEVNEVVKELNTNIENTIISNKKQEKKWKIEISAISLEAEISEGTTDDVMNEYVGHFKNTSKKKGNIGLAAHNRGYPVNYFKDIKKLKKGDEINYVYKKFKKTYIVDKIEIIKDTDWSMLEKTDDNRITLITCVENEPNFRRCIQGIEKKLHIMI